MKFIVTYGMVVVISLGGSLVNTPVDWKYLNKFITLIAGISRCIVVVGGGSLAREMMVGVDDAISKDRIGIAATRLHAQVLISLASRSIDVYDKVLTSAKCPGNHALYVSGGWKPQRTTDDVAVQCAIAHGATTLINCTNVNGIYDRNPAHPQAKMIKSLSSAHFTTLFDTHTPGMHAPFDPVAARRAARHNITVQVVHGKYIQRIKCLLAGKATIHSVITPQ